MSRSVKTKLLVSMQTLTPIEALPILAWIRLIRILCCTIMSVIQQALGLKVSSSQHEAQYVQNIFRLPVF